MNKKLLGILQIILGVITFITVIVLTNDRFDDFAYRNMILLGLVFMTLCIAVFNYFNNKKTNK